MALLDTLQPILSDVLAPLTQRTDSEARFPREVIDALGKAGVLGLTVDTSLGGKGQGLRQAADVVERIAEMCPSTAMVVSMHYCATAVINTLGADSVKRAIAQGTHLTTLAFSEADSRSHF